MTSSHHKPSIRARRIERVLTRSAQASEEQLAFAFWWRTTVLGACFCLLGIVLLFCGADQSVMAVGMLSGGGALATHGWSRARYFRQNAAERE